MEMCREMEESYGERGWKRRMAEMLGVSDSNVQNWVRVGDAPPIVRTAFEAKQKMQELEQELLSREQDKFVIEELEAGSGFRVLSLNIDTGHFIERAITKDIKLAQVIIQIESGALEQKICAVADRFDDLIDNDPDDKQALYSLLNWQKPTRLEYEAEIRKLLNVNHQ